MLRVHEKHSSIAVEIFIIEKQTNTHAKLMKLTQKSIENRIFSVSFSFG